MYKVLLVFNNYNLFDEVKKLGVWRDNPDFVIDSFVCNGNDAYAKLKNTKYDIVITEIRIVGMDGLQLLRHIRTEKLCKRVILYSEFVEFDYARQGIILGAYDYFVSPFDENLFSSLFERIKSEAFEEKAVERSHVQDIKRYFEDLNYDIYKYIDSLFDEIYKQNDVINADKYIKSICEQVIQCVFDENKWLALYISWNDFYGLDSIVENDKNSYIHYYKSIILNFFKDFSELRLKCQNDIIDDVILYILNNPEGDLKRKSIASKFYVNESYLSTVFLAQSGVRLVDYLTTIKLKRANYLLINSDLKVAEIAELLNYKDTAYFSKLFKNRYGHSPSHHRLVDDYNFQI